MRFATAPAKAPSHGHGRSPFNGKEREQFPERRLKHQASRYPRQWPCSQEDEWVPTATPKVKDRHRVAVKAFPENQSFGLVEQWRYRTVVSCRDLSQSLSMGGGEFRKAFRWRVDS
jgi:hypothetical protein